MKILIAEDDKISRLMLEKHLQKWGYEFISTSNGAEAWDVIKKGSPPRIAILDWMMPELDGAELCDMIRQTYLPGYIYVILLTAKGSKDDIVKGLDAGADDYLVKPFHHEELRARIRSGERIIRLEEDLAERIKELEETLNTIRQLKEIIPICMHCKKIRDDDNYWLQLEKYVHKYTGSDFSHGICPECLEKYYPEVLLERKKKNLEES